MKLKALDSFYSTETKQVADKTIFEVDSPALGKDLVLRGLAEIVDDGSVEPSSDDEKGEGAGHTHDATKSETAPKNKAEPAPKNKGE